MNKKIKFKIYYLFYLIPVAVLAYLFWQNTKPVLEVRCDADGKTPLCGALVPTARVAADKSGAVIKEEPVYFDVRLPRKYEQVEAKIEYSDLQNDIFEFGVARDEAKKSFDFMAMENKILDNLGWSKLEKDGLVLYQRKSDYKNIDEILAHPPKFGETLLYRAGLNPPQGVFWKKGATVLDFPIKEKIKFAFFHDGGAINFASGLEGALVYVYKDGKRIGVDALENLEAGIYVVEIKGGENFVLKDGLRIDSPYVAILDGLKIGELKKPINLYLAGSRLLAKTDTVEGVQKLWAGGKAVEIAKPLEQYSETFGGRDLKLINISKGNIELGGTLFFVCPAEPRRSGVCPVPVFYPKYEALYAGADLSEINFIFARYESPQTRGEIKTARAIFNIANAPTSNRKIRFLFSLPNAVKGELVKIESVKLEFKGEKFSFSDVFQKVLKLVIRN